MDFEKAESRFRELEGQYASGILDEERYHTEVAKLIVRDDAGGFWMLDAGSGTWVCNRGDGWTPEDPPASAFTLESQPALPEVQISQQRRVRRWLALGMALVVLLTTAAVVAWRLELFSALGLFTHSNSDEMSPRITIASPPDGSQVQVGKKVSIESVLQGFPDLQAVSHVELQVEGQRVFGQAVESLLQPSQTSLALSPTWYPDTAGRYRISVLAIAVDGTILGETSITLQVTEGVDTPLPGSECSPDATFLRDVNIPDGTAFPPGVWREKVWQIRNSGSCAWESGYRLVLREGQSLNAPDYTAVPSTPAGEAAEIRLSFQAPAEPGSYASTWQLQAPDGQVFGPRLSLDIRVEAQMEESPPPEAPGALQVQMSPDGGSVLLTWEDRSDNEDGFRIYRKDVEANIALTRAGVEEYVDEEVACGNSYSYYVVAFNASGPSPESQAASAVLPPCVPAGVPSLTTTPSPVSAQTPTAPPQMTPAVAPSPTLTAPLILQDGNPTLTLAVTPTQVLASEVFTITFLATDDWGMDRVLVWGVETGDPALDRGRVFVCQATDCSGSWPITRTQGISATWALVALAVDSSGQNSILAETLVSILLPSLEP